MQAYQAVQPLRAIAVVIAMTVMFGAMPVQAQTFTVLHNFSNGSDGGLPVAGLTLDAAGNLYGTTFRGGYSGGDGQCFANGCGIVFKMRHTGSGWLFAPLYTFMGNGDGRNPGATVTIGSNGILYGTASASYETGCGVIYDLRFPASAPRSVLAPWNETVLYTMDHTNGCAIYSPVIFDQAGNLYGTASNGGGVGSVYELTPSAGTWTAKRLHEFLTSDGAFPGYGALIFDLAGNLYGTTSGGGSNGAGVVYELTPSNSGWTDTTLYSFLNGADGGYPEGGVIMAAAGNLYGATTSGGAGGGGTVYQLLPYGGLYAFNLLASLYSTHQSGGTWSSLTMDAAGNLYGTTLEGGSYQQGSVFKLTPAGDSWTFSTVHDFSCATDGCGVYGSVSFDAAGNMYGTASGGGARGYGTVWEITP